MISVTLRFGSLYGFDKGNLLGIVTFSGTDGNNHGIYFGAKYLEKKTGMKPVVYVSDSAHYFIEEACGLAEFGACAASFRRSRENDS